MISRFGLLDDYVMDRDAPRTGWFKLSGTPPNVRLSQVGPEGKLIWDKLLEASQGKAAISLSNIVDGAAYALIYQRDADGREFLNVPRDRSNFYGHDKRLAFQGRFLPIFANNLQYRQSKELL